MNGIRLTTQQGIDSFLQVLFLINPVNRVIRFSNQPLGFEYAQDKEGIPSFLVLADEDTAENFKLAWERCMLLPPGKTCEYYHEFKLPDGAVHHCRVQATGVEMSGDPEHYVLISIIPFKKSITQAKDPYQKEYTEFIDLAAHDLDSPLRKLSTFLDRLKLKLSVSEDEQVNLYISRIEASTRIMRSMIDSLVTLSRMHEKAPDYQPCDLNAILAKVINEIDPLIRDKQPKIEAEQLPSIQADQEQMKILFRELLVNAIKFTSNDLTPVVKIRVAALTVNEENDPRLPAKEKIKIQIEDNGIGFRAEVAEKIFSPFQRLNGKSEFEGNGIGLAISKKIIENHQGIIYAEGLEDSGARFTLILPQINP